MVRFVNLEDLLRSAETKEHLLICSDLLMGAGEPQGKLMAAQLEGKLRGSRPEFGSVDASALRSFEPETSTLTSVACLFTALGVFLMGFCSPQCISSAVHSALERYAWSGNVAEPLTRASSLGRLSLAHLPRELGVHPEREEKESRGA